MARRRRVAELGRVALAAAIRAHGGDLRAVARDVRCALSTIYRALDRHGLRDLAGLPPVGVPVFPKNTEAQKRSKQLSSVFASASPPEPILTDVPRTSPRAHRQRDHIDTSVRVKRETWRAMKKLAIDMDCTVSELVEQAFREFLEQATHASKER